MASMSGPNYSLTSPRRSRLSVRIPRDSLYSSLMESSQHFQLGPDMENMVRDAQMWTTSEEGLSHPASIASSHFSVRSTDHVEFMTPPINPREFPVYGSVRSSLRRREAVTNTESTEKIKKEAQPKEEEEVEAAVGGTSGDGGVLYPSGTKLWLIILAICLAVFVMALDNSIIATAIPRITDDFHSLDDVGWYGSAYMLTGASLQLFFGKLYTFWSIKWTFLAVVGIFEVGSLICAVAPSSVTLIIGRAVAGVGSAGIFAGAFTILAYTVPLRKRPFYTGLVSGMWGISSVVGPLLGGLFTDKVTWRWCFYINLPIGGITLAVITVFFHEPRRDIPPATGRQRFWQLDPLGTCIFMPAVVCLLLALQWGGTTYPWRDSRITSLFMLAAVLLLVFAYLQHRLQDRATVPPRLLKKRSVWASAWFAFNTGACFLASVYFLPIWFQAVKGASPISSGVRNLPMLLAVVFCSVGSGALVSAWGYYTPFMLASAVLMAVGYGLISTLAPNTPAAGWIGYQIVAGVGVGCGLQQTLVAVQVVCDMADIPTATAMVIFAQTLGGALSVTAGQTVFTNILVRKVAEYVPELDPAVVMASGATGIRHAVRAEWLPGVVRAYNDALTSSFYVSVGTASVTILGAVLTEWKSVRERDVQVTAG